MFSIMWEFLKMLYSLTIFCICLAGLVLLALLLLSLLALTLIFNCITIPLYAIACVLSYFRNTAFPRVGYWLLMVYPTRRQGVDTSSLAEFMILLGTVSGLLLSVILLLNGLIIPGLLGCVAAVVIWWKFCPKPHPEKMPDHEKLKRATSKLKRGIGFEEYCGSYLRTHGFHDVKLTPPSGDYGADIVAKDKNGVTWVFQCKHYHSKVGNSCVQEVVAAKKHYGASKAAVMTNSRLTEKAKQLAVENDVLLFECLES